MKTLLFLSIVSLSASVFAANPVATPAAPDVTLLSRYGVGTYSDACYSFRYMNHDATVTNNNYEIIFEARVDFAD